MDEQGKWGELRSAVARGDWREAEAWARGDAARMVYLMSCAARVEGGVSAVEHWRIVGELELAQAKGERWGRGEDGELWRRDKGALMAGAYRMKAEYIGEWGGVKFAVFVYHGAPDSRAVWSADMQFQHHDRRGIVEPPGACELEAEGLLLKALVKLGPR